MTIIEAIIRLDEHIEHTQFTNSQKIAWLSDLDKMVKSQIIDTHAGAEDIAFTGYNAETDMETELLVPFPYDEIYAKWLIAQAYYANRETVNYNNAILVFNAAYTAYEDYYNRTHAPLRAATRFSF